MKNPVKGNQIASPFSFNDCEETGQRRVNCVILMGISASCLRIGGREK